MGRRSTSSTKSGKFMNPTDQASKYQPLDVELLKLVFTCLITLLLSNARTIIVFLFIHLKGKEARKRELKKVCLVSKRLYSVRCRCFSIEFLTLCFICSLFYQNKKQRMMVRAAVLKMKDPRQIIRDMEKLDEMGEGLENVHLTLVLQV